MLLCNPLDWYWVVGGEETVVWSSNSMSYLDQTDNVYVQWLSRGGMPTNIATKENLVDVINSSVLPLILNLGVPVTCNTNNTLNATYSFNDLPALADAARDISSGLGMPNNILHFWDINKSPILVPQSYVVSLYLAIRNYKMTLPTVITEVINGVTASLPATPITIA